MNRILAIDAGNTRIKWGLFDDNGNILESGAQLNTDILEIKLPEATRIIISNVAGERIKKQLKNILPKEIDTNWIQAKTSEFNIKNLYEQTEKLGTDRWAALIAAWHLKKSPCVIVNAGTAITIDALTVNDGNGEFIGGMILPGIHLMQRSLGLATAKLPTITSEKLSKAETKIPLNAFAKNTEAAMQAGAINAACGAILQFHAALRIQCKQVPNIVISGGDAELIKDNLIGDVTNLAIIVDNLVLRGLYLIENSMPKITVNK